MRDFVVCGNRRELIRRSFRRLSLFAIILLNLVGCSARSGAVAREAAEGPADILLRAARSNWYVRVTDLDGNRADGRAFRDTQSTFRIGDTRISTADVVTIQRLVDVGLNDWKPFAAAVGVGGLASLFAGFLYSGITDQSYEGAALVRWYAAGAVAGVVVLLSAGRDRQDQRWVPLWPAEGSSALSPVSRSQEDAVSSPAWKAAG
jgi:hypothetical protein